MRLTRLLPLAVGLAMFFAGGCETDNVSFFISHNAAGSGGGEGGLCTYDSSTELVGPGLFDVSVGPSAYEVRPVYVNQLLGSRNPIGADPNGIHVTSAEVELRDAAGSTLSIPELPNPFSMPTSTFVPSGSEAVGGVTVIPNNYRQALADMGAAGGTIIAAVRVHAETNGDNNISPEPWQWPIEICNGCLVRCDTSGTGESQSCCDIGQDVLCTLTPPDC